MKKILSVLFAILIAFGLSGCALFEFLHDKDNVVDLGDGKNAVKWHLVLNDNDYRLVDSAYFEFDETYFKYYENGVLKKQGTHRITFYGVENSNVPLHLNLNFGEENYFTIYDYVDCYTEDSKDNIHQFTIVSQGYHVESVRDGGVPVRDYHLSEMPYALGTYVKEGATPYTYQNGKVNYLNSSKLDGKFCDDNGNTLYLVNNSYSANYQSAEYSKYTVYMRYENATNNTFIEGTIKLSRSNESLPIGIPDIATIYVLHGENEPGIETGTYAQPDYRLANFSFGADNSITFSDGDYFYGNTECSYNPTNFVGGTYYKQA